MSRWNLVWLLVVPGLVLLGLAVTASAPPPDRDYQLVRAVVDVLAEVDRSYVRELTDAERKKLVEDMITGGLEKLDPYSEYLNEDDLSAFETQSEGQFGGIGVYLGNDPKTGYLKVESLMPGTPAYQAGVQANDLILKVRTEKGEKSTEKMTIPEARQLIKGEKGTQVTLTILRDGSSRPEDVTLTRAVIQLHPVMGVARDPADPAKWDYLADKEAKVALVRLTWFNERSDKEVRAAVEEAERAGARALVLDLRDNPGGLLDQAVKVADLFLAEGTIVRTRDRNDRGRTWAAKAAETAFEPAAARPMAVLVNRGSASASEIVAAALHDNGRAVVVGERTYGKGSVQKVFGLPGGRAAVKLTSEAWLTPAGKTITRGPDAKEADEWGVRPDPGFEVKLSDPDRLEYVRHVQQLNLIKGRPGADAPPADPKPGNKDPAKPYVDPVLDKAVRHLRAKLKEVGAAPAVDRARTAA